MPEYVIAVDAIGGDNAPEAIVQGAMDALRLYPDVRLLLFGPKAQIEALTRDASDVAARFDIIDAPEVISLHESPTLAIRRKLNSSLVQAMMAVKDGRAKAVVSAGSTGAILAGGMFRVGRIHGLDRPALAPLVPGRKKPFLLIDAGANVDCQPRFLEQFGLMGAVYMQQVEGIAAPNVCLANIGEEPEKGDQLVKEAYQLMSAQTAYKFGGNVEAREIPMGQADVVVCDGFVGNVILKYTEGLASALMGLLKDAMMSTTRSKIGALLLKPALKSFKNIMNTEEHGGGPLLGCKGAVIKAHGNSSAKAFMNAIRQARKMIEGDVVGHIERGLAGLSAKEANQNEQEG